MHDPPLIYSTVERQKLPLRMRKKWKRERAQGEEKEKKRNLCRGLKVEKCTGSTHLKATTLGSMGEQESSTEHRARSPSVRGGREREGGEIWRIDSLILLLPLLPPFPPSKSERILRLLPHSSAFPLFPSPPLSSQKSKGGFRARWALEKLGSGKTIKIFPFPKFSLPSRHLCNNGEWKKKNGANSLSLKADVGFFPRGSSPVWLGEKNRFFSFQHVNL